MEVWRGHARFWRHDELEDSGAWLPDHEAQLELSDPNDLILFSFHVPPSYCKMTLQNIK
jgi:hypothetical protein